MRRSPRLVLASNSPRRQELLARLGLSFTVHVAPVDEAERPEETPERMVVRLARAKAEAVPLQESQVLVAADTTVALGTRVLGKPRDPDDARRMLLALRGRVHSVHTGLVLRRLGESRAELVTTRVRMRPYGPAELEDYIASGAAMDKAGAYGIQDRPFAPVEQLEGCYLNVVGLPLCHLARALLGWGIAVPYLPPPYCRTLLGQPCPVALFEVPRH